MVLLGVGMGGPQKLLGVGIYTVPEAARLTEVSTGRIRRWLRGYAYKTAAGEHASEPVFHGDLQPVDDALALSFLDVLEVRFVDAFIARGVRWKTLREAHARACELMGHAHPFSTGRFETDGRVILLDYATRAKGPGVLLNIVADQYEFRRIVVPFLKHIDFAEDAVRQALRWWPLGKKRQVVIDPHRNFGQAIVAREGVPTAVLARAYAAECRIEERNAVERVAAWFQVARSSVRDAVAWDTHQRAA